MGSSHRVRRIRSPEGMRPSCHPAPRMQMDAQAAGGGGPIPRFDSNPTGFPGSTSGRLVGYAAHLRSPDALSSSSRPWVVLWDLAYKQNRRHIAGGQSGRADLNRRPPAPHAGALNRAALRPDADCIIAVQRHSIKKLPRPLPVPRRDIRREERPRTADKSPAEPCAQRHSPPARAGGWSLTVRRTVPGFGRYASHP